MIKTLILGGQLADVKLYGFDEMGEVNLKDELEGKTTFLVDAARRHAEDTAFYGVRFALDELRRNSVIVFHNGALADVADATLQSSIEFGQPELKVYSLNGVKLGVAADDDVDSEAVWGRLADKSDAIVAIVRTCDAQRLKRIQQLQGYFSLPAVVRCGKQLYAFGAQSAPSFTFS